MPLPNFLLLIAIVVIAAAVTIWLVMQAGVPMVILAIGVLFAAGAFRLFSRVE